MNYNRFKFGWAGGILIKDSEPNTIEMSLELSRILGYTSDMMITAHIEYSF